MKPIETRSLTLALKTPEETRSFVDALSPEDRSQVSPVWLARVMSAVSSDPWIHGYTVIHRPSGAVVGFGGFKAPPSSGMVELAYAVEPEYQGKGYATEVAAALATFAFSYPEVKVVRGHTLPEANASTRVLGKCGFQKIGEVDDPEDGRVWRWEMHRPGGA